MTYALTPADFERAFARLLPGSAEVAVMTGDVGPEVLTAAEQDYIRGAVPKRVGEFAAARVCARRAIRRAGNVPDPVGDPVPDLVPGPERDVTWPAGLVGAITHCTGLRAAVVAPATEVLSLGIDAEVNEPLPDDAWSVVSVPGEAEVLGNLGASGACQDVNLDRLLFSAKEAIFKTWFPVTRRWLDFTECRLTVQADREETTSDALMRASGTFHGEFLVPGIDLTECEQARGEVVAGLDGRWHATESHLLTAVSLSR